jgi:hypothetical protein
MNYEDQLAARSAKRLYWAVTVLTKTVDDLRRSGRSDLLAIGRDGADELERITRLYERTERAA